MISCRCQRWPFHQISWTFVQHSLDKIRHCDLYLPWDGVVEGHAKVVVYLSSGYHEGPSLPNSSFSDVNRPSNTSCWACDIFMSSMYQAMVHCFPSIIFLTTHQSYSFCSNPCLSIKNTDSFCQKRRAA